MASKYPEDLSDTLASLLSISDDHKVLGQSNNDADTNELESSFKTGTQLKLKYCYTESK